MKHRIKKNNDSWNSVHQYYIYIHVIVIIQSYMPYICYIYAVKLETAALKDLRVVTGKKGLQSTLTEYNKQICSYELETVKHTGFLDQYIDHNSTLSTTVNSLESQINDTVVRCSDIRRRRTTMEEEVQILTARYAVMSASILRAKGELEALRHQVIYMHIYNSAIHILI